MKHQAEFPQKINVKIIKVSSAAILLGALRVKRLLPGVPIPILLKSISKTGLMRDHKICFYE